MDQLTKLDTIGLDKQDLENPNPAQDTIGEPQEPMQQSGEAKEFFLLETPEGFKLQLGSCLYDSISLSVRAMQIITELKQSKPEQTKLNGMVG